MPELKAEMLHIKAPKRGFNGLDKNARRKLSTSQRINRKVRRRVTESSLQMAAKHEGEM